MNTIAKLTLENVMEQADVYKRKAGEVCAKYAGSVDKARVEAARYKDEGSFFSSQERALADSAKRDLMAASETFSKEVKRAVSDMKKELAASLTEPVKSGFIEKCRILREFGITPSRSMAEALLDQNGGNLTGLAVLQSVMTATGASYKIDYPDVNIYEKDLAVLEKLAASCDHYAPSDRHSELCAICRGETRKDGSSWDGIGLIIHRNDVERAIGELGNMVDRWSRNVSYTLVDVASAEIAEEKRKDAEMAGEELPPEEDVTPSAAVVSVDDDGTQLARELGAEEAKANETTAAGLRHYAK